MTDRVHTSDNYVCPICASLGDRGICDGAYDRPDHEPVKRLKVEDRLVGDGEYVAPVRTELPHMVTVDELPVEVREQLGVVS